MKKSENNNDVTEYINHALEDIRKAEQKSVEKIKNTALTVNEHVHKKPWFYIACAAIGGLLMALLCCKPKKTGKD